MLSAKRRIAFLAVLTILAIVFSIPSLTRNSPDWWTKSVPIPGMRLGLDLQGGMYLTLKVNLPRAVQNHLELSIGDLINRSINEVLSRTVITSSTVFMVVLALLLMGGVLLRDFALALMIGVIVGTYSSIFVASPIVYMWPSGKRAQPQLVARTAKHHA